MPNLYRIILPVKDIDEAATFYSRILGIEGSRVSPGRHYFNLGNTILACYSPAADGDELKEGWMHHENQYIYISVNDLEETFSLASSSKGEIIKTIEEMPWGEILFYMRDPSGNPICFVDEKTIFTG